METKGKQSAVKKHISLHQIFKICTNNGVFRIVKTDDCEKYFNIIVCGVFRIQRNKENNKVTQWVYHLKTPDSGIWKKRKSLPVAVRLFWTQNQTFLMNDWLIAAVKQVINSLVASGFDICDDTSLFRIRQWRGKTKFITTLFPDEARSRYYADELCAELGKKKFTYPTDTPYTNKKEMFNEIIMKITNRSWVFIPDSARTAASKLLCKHIWQMINKPIFSLYVKSVHCSMMHKSVHYSVFDDYQAFAQKIRFHDEVDFGGLWPMVGLLNQQCRKGTVYLSGKTRELFEQLTLPDEVSYGDFKRLRTVSPTLVAKLREVPRPDRQHTEGQVKTVIRLLRHPFIKRYPVSVIFWILERLAWRFCPDRANEIYRVCDKWLGYHVDLYRNIGFRVHERRWRTEVNHLEHVLDWLIETQPNIHKNQEWPSFWRLAEEWTQHLRDNDDYYEGGKTALVSEWECSGINWSDTMPGVKEINRLDDLYNEGREMEHCVASYAALCANGEYRVLSLITDQERATLGLFRKENHKDFCLDQIRGVRNEAVTRKMMSMGRLIVKYINS